MQIELNDTIAYYIIDIIKIYMLLSINYVNEGKPADK